mgnify:FL=1
MIAYFVYLYEPEKKNLEIFRIGVLYIILSVTDILGTCNNAINFFLYCLAGGTFRTYLRNVCPCTRGLASNKREQQTQMSEISMSVSRDKIAEKY